MEAQFERYAATNKILPTKQRLPLQVLFTPRLWSRFFFMSISLIIPFEPHIMGEWRRCVPASCCHHLCVGCRQDADPQQRHGLFWTRRDVRVGGLLTFTIWSSMINGPTKARIVPNKTAMTPATINPTATLDLLISMSLY